MLFLELRSFKMTVSKVMASTIKHIIVLIFLIKYIFYITYMFIYGNIQ